MNREGVYNSGGSIVQLFQGSSVPRFRKKSALSNLPFQHNRNNRAQEKAQ